MNNHAPSPIEAAFWAAAVPRIPGLQREVWIGRYRVDFLVPQKKAVIELYSFAHHHTKEKMTYDAGRERDLQKLGYNLIRFTGQDVYFDADQCVDDVLEILARFPDVAEAGLLLSGGPSTRAALPAPQVIDIRSIAAPMASPRRRPGTTSGMKPWQWLILGGMGLVLTGSLFALFAVLSGVAAGPQLPALNTPLPAAAPVQLANPKAAPTLTTPPAQTTAASPAETPRPTPPLLSAASALRVAECAINWSLPWKSIPSGKATALTPPAGATCGIFNFKVTAGEAPVIIFNSERYTDLGSCLNGCIVRIRAVPVSIDVQGLSKPNAQWDVSYYWDSR